MTKILFKEEKTEVPDVARVEEVTATEDTALAEVPKTLASRSTTSESQPASIDETNPQPEPERTGLPIADSAASKDGTEKHEETKDENSQTSTTAAAASKPNDDEDDDPELSRSVLFQCDSNSSLCNEACDAVGCQLSEENMENSAEKLGTVTQMFPNCLRKTEISVGICCG